jgi:hypothetical protein
MRALLRGVLTVVLAGCAAVAAADDVAEGRPASEEQPEATPYRPTISTPAALSAPGWIEIEGGGLRDLAGGPARRDSLPYTVKLAFTPDWGIRLGGDAWVRQVDADGHALSGFGDTSIIVKRRFAVDDKSAFGVEGGVLLPTSRNGVGNDRADWFLTGIYSADLPADLHTDVNLEGTRFGAPDPGTSRTQLLWAASLSKTLNERWGVVGEFSGTYQRGAEGTTQLLVAATFNVSRALVLDAGAAHGLRSGSNDRSFFAGFTWLAARLF